MSIINMRIILIVLAALISLSASAQDIIQHVTATSNLQGHITTLNHPALNNKPGAIVIVSQQYGKYNPNEIGVWYANGKWTIFNQNRQPIPVSTIFNVIAIDPAKVPNAFVHTTNAGNTRGHISTLSNALTDAKPNSLVFITQRFGKYNTSPVGVWYSGGKWKLYNEDRKPIPVNTQFNILVVDPGQIPASLSGLKGQGFTHVVTDDTRRKFRTKHVSYINNAATTNKSNMMLFVTQKFRSTYNTSPVGVWYDAPSWTVFNEDRKMISENIALNVLAVDRPSTNFQLIRNHRVVAINSTTPRNEEKNKWKAATRLNTTAAFVLPYKEKEDKDEPVTAETSTDIQGPNTSLGKDINAFFADEGLNQFLNKLNLFREVYEDRNPHSGYMYYLPKNYNLRWNRDGGEYSFYIYYLSADGDGRGNVIITAELTPNINREDIAIAEKLLSKQLGKDIKLRPLPLKDTPKVSFGSSLTNFDVKDESIQTNIPSDFLEPIIVSWKMERRVDDFIGAMMNNLGLNGNIEFSPMDEIEKTISVPVRLKINDPQTYGKMEYAETSALLNGFVNPLDYPVQLKELVVMRTKTNGELAVETIPLNNYEVEPQKVFSSFRQEERDALLNGDVISRVWVEYALKNCLPCNESVQRKILGGTSGSRVKPIALEILTPIGFSGARSLKVLIKSVQGDPKGTSEVLLPIVTVTEDNITLSGGELFVPEGGSPDYQYQLVLIQTDGTTLASEWIHSNDLFIVLGENSIREHFRTDEAATEPQPMEMDEVEN